VAHDTADNWKRVFFIAAVTVIELLLFFLPFLTASLSCSGFSM